MNKYLSVIICTHNRVSKVTKCLDSLLCQTYDRKKFEIIVIDDGSTDNTQNVITQYRDIFYIKLEDNRGIGYSRNVGISKSLGEIAIFIDDDCIPSIDWLENFVRPYDNPQVMSVGGRIIILGNSLADLFQRETGYGMPYPLYQNKSNIFRRFFAYLRENVSPSLFNEKRIVHVQEIYTGNASYRVKNLKAVGGFHNYTNGEDMDLIRRLRTAFPKSSVVYQPNAVVFHDDSTTIIKLLKKTYKRSFNILEIYIKEGKTPPIYPFPLIVMALGLCAVISNSIMVLSLLLLSPLILYWWWPIRAVKRINFRLTVLSYVQLLIESVSNIGILKYYLGKLV